jgi:hypothetical protein
LQSKGSNNAQEVRKSLRDCRGNAVARRYRGAYGSRRQRFRYGDGAADRDMYHHPIPGIGLMGVVLLKPAVRRDRCGPNL